MLSKFSCKRVLCLTTALLLCFAMVSSAVAVEIEPVAAEQEIISVASSIPIDTTALTQTQYEAVWENLSVDTPIRNLCELFITSIYASRRSSQYDCLAFTTSNLSAQAQQNGTLAYIESVNQYQREVNELCNYNIVSDSIQFDNFSAVVNGNTCNAEIAVHYSYVLTGAFNDTCYLNCVYYLTLIKTTTGWSVESATTNLPTEQGDSFAYAAFDAHAAALSAVRSPAVVASVEEPTATTTVADPNAVAQFTVTGYSVSSAVSYAAKYYNKTNSLFGANGANCQNFASQCVWAGLLAGCNATGTSITALPAVSTSRNSSSLPTIWCHNQCSTYYSNYNLNWAWDNVNGFLKLIKMSDHTQEGPQGYYWTDLKKASAGDVIAWDTAGKKNLDNADYDHAMFVTKVTGTYGSRTTANIFIAANTKQSATAYMPLPEYGPNIPENCYAMAHITGGNYRLSNDTINANPSETVQSTDSILFN